MDMTADQVLDCRDVLCPAPIIRLSQAIQQLAPGQVLLLETTDPGSKPDVAAWARQSGNTVLRETEEGEVFRFLIRKAG